MSVKDLSDDARRFGPEPISVRVPEACRLTGIGRSKFYQLVARGEIEVVKIGAMTLVPVAALHGLIDRARKPGAGGPGGPG